MAKLGRCRVQYSHSGVGRGQQYEPQPHPRWRAFPWGMGDDTIGETGRIRLVPRSVVALGRHGAESVEGRVRLSLFPAQAQLPAPAVHYIQEDHVRVPEEGRDTRWRSCSLSRIDRWTRSIFNTHSQNKHGDFNGGTPIYIHWSCIYRWDVPWISYSFVRLGHHFTEHPQYVERTVREDESSNLVDASRRLKLPRMWRRLEGLHCLHEL